jgi:hypothetical protein
MNFSSKQIVLVLTLYYAIVISSVKAQETGRILKASKSTNAAKFTDVPMLNNLALSQVHHQVMLLTQARVHRLPNRRVILLVLEQ